MQTIRKRLSILLFACSIIAIVLITLFVNITINDKFDKYRVEIQNKRHERTVSYFQEVYDNEGKWSDVSGIELMHEAYMGNYCITLEDNTGKVVWGMDPKDLQNRLEQNKMPVEDKGVYSTKTYEIKSKGTIVGYVRIGQYSSLLLTQEDINFKESINKSIIISGMITLLIIVCISLMVSKHFSIPIKDVAKLSVELSKGNYNTKSIAQSKIKELEELRSSVNVLAENLKYQDTLRKRLVSDITHEVRAPLNVLQNNLEAMIDGIFPTTIERLSSLDEEVIRFGRLLNNLNILKEFESESSKLYYETIYLDELLKDLCQDFYMEAKAKNIRLNIDIEPNKDYRITGDKDSIKQVFINLLSNSFKFTENAGNIKIKLYIFNHNIIVEVTDDGIGISKEDLPFIFERLYRGDKSRQQIEGDGIGLTIVKNILKLHDASIKVDSEEGKGAVFKISFKTL